jgi:aspartate racemase
MKTIGMIGGTGWVSTAQYYRLINEETNKWLGGVSSAKIILYSFDYSPIDKLNQVEDHAGVFELVLGASLI